MKAQKRSSKSKSKRHLNFRNIFIILIIFSVIGGSIYYFLNLRVNNIIILGTNLTKDVTIIEQAGISNYPKLINLKKNNIESSLKELPLIESAEVKTNIKGTLTIKAIERYPLFYYQPNHNIILSDGTSISDLSYPGLPTLINYTPEDILKDFVKGLNNVDKDIIYMINEIEYKGTNNNPTFFVLIMNDGNTVYVNTVNIKQLNKYLLMYDYIVETYGNEKGVLPLDSDSDASVFKTYKAIAAEEAEKENQKNDED